MDRDELLKLVGEQTLLSEERLKLNAQRAHQQADLLRRYNEITACHGTPRWLEGAQQLLLDLHGTQVRLVELDVRINELRRLTGR